MWRRVRFVTVNDILITARTNPTTGAKTAQHISLYLNK